MKAKIMISSVVEMEIDDKFAVLAQEYPTDNWDEELAAELVGVVKNATGLKMFDECDDWDEWSIVAVYDTDYNPMIEC